MTDAALQEYQRARRLLMHGTTGATRQVLQSVLLLDRGKQFARASMMLQVACLVRDRQESQAEALLDTLTPIHSEEWRDLMRLLREAPERQHPSFERYLAHLESRRTGHTPDATPPPMPDIPERHAWDGWIVTGAALGGCSLITAWLVVLGLPRGSWGVLPAVLGAMTSLLSPERGNPRFFAMALCVAGTLISFSLLAMEVLRTWASS
jgi:hypothetical protein